MDNIPRRLLTELSRTEATLVAAWLKEQDKYVERGWISLWKLSPDDISQEYQVEKKDVLIAARRIQEDEP